MIDIRTALAIFNKPWLIEYNYASIAAKLLLTSHNSQQAVNDAKAELAAHVHLPFAALPLQGVVYAPTTIRSATTHTGYEGANTAVLPITGPLMKADFCGEFGTASLIQEIAKIEATKSVQKIILYIDSPGGTVDGTEALANAIRNCKKQTIALADGMCCSAAYWIGSSANKLFATGHTTIIGSIGTKISFYDTTAADESEGYILREYTATASSDKGADFKEALKGNGKRLIETMLNPLNDVFVSAVKRNRGSQLNQEETLSGSTFVAQKAKRLGLIDGFATLSEVIQQSNLSNKKNNVKMEITAFPNILAAAGNNDVIEVVEGGFLIQEDVLRTIDAAHGNAITQLNQITQTATEFKDTATAQIAQLEQQLQEERANAIAQKNTIDALVQENATLKAAAPNFVPPTHQGAEQQMPTPQLTGDAKLIAEANEALKAEWTK